MFVQKCIKENLRISTPLMNCDTFQSVSDFSMIVEIHFENEFKGMSLAFRVLFAISSGAEKLQNYEVILDPILKLSNNHQITERGF